MKRRLLQLIALPRLALFVLPAFIATLMTLMVAQTAQAQTYKVRAGDTLRIEVLEDESLNRTVLVAPDGRISFPTVGSVRAAGQSVDSIQRVLTNSLSANFASEPNVFVSLQSLFERPIVPAGPVAPPPVISIYIVGEASQTGKIDLEPGTNVLQAFAVMGGFTNFAAVKRVQLRRIDPQTGAQTIVPLNYKNIEAGDRSGLTTLRDGDTIVVPQRRLFE